MATKLAIQMLLKGILLSKKYDNTPKMLRQSKEIGKNATESTK